jgi:16S rRNA C967 or C1407 C5-methylase (RsmB/RsmF family)
MTVSELIAKLQTLPPDAVVVYMACSDYQILEENQIVLQTAEEAKVKDDDVIAKMKAEREAAQNPTPATRYLYWHIEEQTFFRAGRYVRCSRTDFPPEEEPVYATVVTFPGN